MNYRHIITVDDQQVAIVDKVGVVLEHEKNLWKGMFAKDFDIGGGGVGVKFRKPKDGLKLWKPKK